MSVLIHVGVGDTVEVLFRHHEHPKPFTVLVANITKRYGRVNDGRTPQNPLISGINLETGAAEQFDQGYVTSVVKRVPNPFGRPKKNIYRDEVAKEGRHIKVQGGNWTGTLTSLAIAALAPLPYQIERRINLQRLGDLYDRDPLGLVSRGMRSWLVPSQDGLGFIYTVNAKRFKKWVSRHWSEILCTTRDLMARETRSIRRWEDEYWRSVEQEIEENENEYWRSVEREIEEEERRYWEEDPDADLHLGLDLQ